MLGMSPIAVHETAHSVTTGLAGTKVKTRMKLAPAKQIWHTLRMLMLQPRAWLLCSTILCLQTVSELSPHHLVRSSTRQGVNTGDLQ